ncbi:MAG: endonuclease/exonuclease/phosphatase family protein [Pirellulaceae bacterium]|nr:endonuclease/exonuclease/phosphatase family protein [Pirellulaceae bacterium]
MAAIALPAPARAVVSSRWGSRLAVLLLPLLIAGGVITLDWSDGVPKLRLNPEKTAEVKQKVAAGAEQLKEKFPDAVDTAARALENSPLAGQLAQSASWSNQTTSASALPPRNPATVRIASFNIQVFGESKAAKPHVMDVLAQVVRNFDVVAIQELRTQNEAVLDQFLALINAGGGSYRYVVGPRLGRTVSKEQYVYVYDAQRIAIDPQSVVTIPDPPDYLHREPLIARFQVRTSPPEAGFSFILVNIHTDPDETDTELDALDDVFVAVQRNVWREDDVILLGDLNVSQDQLGELGRLPDMTWTVRGEPTNTRGTKSYDNIVFNQRASVEFTGQAAVMNLMEMYGLTVEQALEVSDHLPVWAEFHAFEGMSGGVQVAARPPAPLQPAAGQPPAYQPPAGQPATGQPTTAPSSRSDIPLLRLLPGRR